MNNSRQKLQSLLTGLLLGSTSSAAVYGQTASDDAASKSAISTSSNIESALAKFSGNQTTSTVYGLALSSTHSTVTESGSSYSSQLNLSGTVIDSTALDNYGLALTTRERRGSVGISGTVNKLTTVGTTFGYTTIDKTSKWSSLRVGHWWNKATISTDLEVLNSSTEKKSRDYLDTDSQRVLTPSHVNGKRYTLSLTWLATTRAMILGSVSYGKSEDRPDSLAETIEGRYFFDATLTAVHIKAGNYADLEGVSKKTDYGRILAKEWELQIHQHLSDRWIGTLVARDHFETEEARSSETANSHRHGRFTQGRMRYRFVTGPVTDSVSEVYFFTGKYTSVDTKKSINHMGMGGIYVF